MKEYIALASRIRESLVELETAVKTVWNCRLYCGSAWFGVNGRDHYKR